MGLAWNIYAPLGTLSTFFFNPVFQVSTAKNEINLFNNHILIVAPVTFAPAGAMTPSAEFLLNIDNNYFDGLISQNLSFRASIKANSSETEACFWIYICLF